MDKKFDELNFYINEYLDQISRDIEYYEAKVSGLLELSSLYLYYTGLLDSSTREYSHLSRLKEVME